MSAHDDYLDPDRWLWPEEPPCEKCKHDKEGGCDLDECDYQEKENG